MLRKQCNAGACSRAAAAGVLAPQQSPALPARSSIARHTSNLRAPCGSGLQRRLPGLQSASLQHRRRRAQHSTVQCHAAAQQLLAAVQVPPTRDVAAMLVAGVGAYAWVKLFDWFARHEMIDQKLSRKLVHITAGPIFVLAWPLFSWAANARFYAAIIPALNGLRLMAIGFGLYDGQNTIRAVSREGDRRELLRGPLYYVVVLVGVTLVYWRNSTAGILVVALMCGGDGLADIVGRRFGGSAKLPHNPNKSWAGSAAMFLGGMGMASAYMMLFAKLGYFHFDAVRTLPIVAAICAAATITESLPINQTVDDNLSVPGIAAIIGFFALHGL